MPRGYSFDRSSSGSLAMLAGMRRASSRINAPHAPVCDASHGEAPPIMVRLPTGGAPHEEIAALLRPCIRRRRWHRHRPDRRDPAVGNRRSLPRRHLLANLSCPSRPLNTTAVSTAPAASQYWRRSGGPRRASQIGSCATAGVRLEVDVGERLAVVVLDDEAGCVCLLDAPRRREAAGGWHGTSRSRAQSTTRGCLLHRCVHHSGQRRERRRAPHALGYTLSALHPLWR